MAYSICHFHKKETTVDIANPASDAPSFFQFTVMFHRMPAWIQFIHNLTKISSIQTFVCGHRS